VDSQAEEELADMSSNRRLAVDELAEEHARLSDQHQQLQARASGHRARIRTMEADAALHRQQLGVVLDKSETDDQLVQALKQEVQRLKEQAQQQAQGRREDGFEVKLQAATRSAVATATKNIDTELQRLRRLCKQQADQLTTQDQIIKELRMSGRK